MKNSQNLPQSLGDKDFKGLLQISLAHAFERTGTTPRNIDAMINDVIEEFPNLNEETIKQALRNGGLGKYGQTYKLTTQAVCIWIRKYIEDNQPMKAFHNADPLN